MPYIYKDRIPVVRSAGVYLITNTTNGKVYVGSSAWMAKRMRSHQWCLRNGRHVNKHLQSAWKKYGETSFRFSVIEKCKETDCVSREQYWLDTLNACSSSKGYNVCPLAGTTLGQKIDKDVCKRMSELLKKSVSAKEARQRATAAAAIANRGKKRDPAVVAKISESNKGKKKSEAHRQKTKETHWSKGKDAERIIAGFRAKLTGRKLTPEHRASISEGGRKRWAKVRENATTS